MSRTTSLAATGGSRRSNSAPAVRRRASARSSRAGSGSPAATSCRSARAGTPGAISSPRPHSGSSPSSLTPAPPFRIVAVAADPGHVDGLARSGRADEVRLGHAGRLELEPDSFDVVLYRLVLHHIADQGPLAPCFSEA